jgi:hypothetical protein
LLTATFAGTANRDEIEIAVSGSNMVVTINGSANLAPIATTSDITINAGGDDDRILIEGTQVPVHIFGDAGDDDLTTTETSGNLSSMAAPVTYDGGTGQDRIKLWDDLLPASVIGSYHVTASTLDRQSFAGMTFMSLENLDFRGPAGNDHIFVDAAPANLPNYDLYGGLGDDTFEFGAAADSLDSLLSPIEIHGEIGNDAVIIHDGSNTADATWTVTNFTVGRGGWAGMRYNTSESVTIDAGSGAETFNVESTHATAPLTINAGGGNDVARLAPTTQLLDDIVTPVTFNGGGGTDQLVLFDDANTFADTYTIDATGASRAFFGGASFATIEDVTLSAGSGDDTIDVTETAPGAPASIISNAGADTVSVNNDGAGIAQVIFAQTENLAALNIGSGGAVKLAAGGASTLVTSSLSIAGTGRFDVTDNAVIVDYTGASPLAAIRAALASGYAAGAWNGAGINSSTAAATPQHAVGYAEASAIFSAFPATFGGHSVDNTAVVLRYTRAGDANLDGTVNLSDFNRLASSFGAGSLWSEGNFNYDSNVNLSDFNLLASTFGQSDLAPTQ